MYKFGLFLLSVVLGFSIFISPANSLSLPTPPGYHPPISLLESPPSNPRGYVCPSNGAVIAKDKKTVRCPGGRVYRAKPGMIFVEIGGSIYHVSSGLGSIQATPLRNWLYPCINFDEICILFGRSVIS